MNRFLIVIGCLVFILTSCRNEFEPPFMENSTLDIDELSGVEQNIAISILAQRYGGYIKGQPQTRGLLEFTITPYVENGDTLLYIAQYSDGWEIYSANQGAGMLVFSSDHGKFDIDDPKMPKPVKDLIHANAEAVKLISNETNVKAHASWGPFALSEEDLSKGRITVNDKSGSKAISYPEVPSGKWVMLKYEKILDDTYISPKLTKTEWDQDDPWNSYSKMIKNHEGDQVRGYAGCAAISVSQYLYYTHFLNNIPLYTISYALPIQNGYDFTFAGQSSSVWNNMAISWSLYGMNETAMFIGYIGHTLKADYETDGTTIDKSEMLNYLGKVYNTTFSESDVNLHYIISSIDNKYPVISGAFTNKKSNGKLQKKAGHSFLIDRYKTRTTKVKYYYGLEREPWIGPGPDPYMSDQVDENGNILRYAYTNEVIQTNEYNEISMNWGYSGDYDDLFYSPWASDWEAGGHIFNLEHKIFKRADIK